MFKYSAAAGGFFHAEVHGDAIPQDCVDLSDEYHAALMQGQQRGQMIVAGADGRPVLVDPPPPSREMLEAGLRAAVQRRMDAAARAQGFRGLSDAISYADEPAAPELQAKALDLRAWRSRVWSHVNSALAGGELPQAEQLLQGLPAL